MSPFLQPTFLLSILIALSVHEAAHAFTANRLGDPTAREMGRLTLNPIAHLDLLGSLLFLLVGFGWGKPVPVNPRHFHRPKRDSALTAFAGPFSNLALAILSFVILRVAFGEIGRFDLIAGAASGVDALPLFLRQFLESSLFINLALMAFNLLPVAPLDGSKVLEAFIPYRLESRYEEFMRVGPYVLLGLLIAGSVFQFPFLYWWISLIADSVLRGMEAAWSLTS